MAGTVTIDEDKGRNSWIKRIEWTWTATSGGAADGTTTYGAYSGEALELITAPGSTAPTASYDVTITDASGYDVLAGQGENLSATDTEYVANPANLGAFAGTSLTLNVTNAGNAGQGTTILLFK